MGFSLTDVSLSPLERESCKVERTQRWGKTPQWSLERKTSQISNDALEYTAGALNGKDA